MKENLGQRVRRLRKQQHLTQKELGKRIGVVRSYIGHIERGRTQAPGKEVIRSLARVLETNAADLLAAAGYLPSEEPGEESINLADPKVKFWLQQFGRLSERDKRIIMREIQTLRAEEEEEIRREKEGE